MTTRPAPYLIRPFEPADAGAFAALNLRWIEQLFAVEEEDRRQLERPQETILAKGGAILIAVADGEVVGTGALIPVSHPGDDARLWAEIVKMATAPHAQNRGIGAAILDGLIDVAGAMGVDALWLETNDSLTAATALYERKGFRPLSQTENWPTPYSRCNLQMVRAV